MNRAERGLPNPAALVVAGAVTALLLVGRPVGVGVPLAAAAVGLAVAAQRPRTPTPAVVADVALALMLAGTAAVTAAGWVLSLALVGAAGSAAVAVAGGPSWMQLAAAPLAAVRTIRDAGRQLLGVVADRLDPDAVRRSAPGLRGAGIALVVLTVFGTLFASADRAFAELTERYLVPDLEIDLLAGRVLVGALVTVGAATLALAPSRARRQPAAPARRRLERAEWLPALIALDLLFAAFVAVQITVLFGGHAHVLETTGLTYAEYAREGFFQLLVAAALTLAVIAAAVRWSRGDDRPNRRSLQILLGVLCVLTLFVLASALRRLGLYEQAFGFTRARMVAHGVLIWFAALFVLVMVAGARWEGRWLPRAALAISGVALLGFSLVRPDALIAEHDVRRFEQTGRIDLAYLDGLSVDAVPALSRLPAGLRSCVLTDDAARLRGDDPWYATNLSRRQARAVLDGSDVVGQPCRRASPGEGAR